jgi:hypothetical protein
MEVVNIAIVTESTVVPPKISEPTSVLTVEPVVITHNPTVVVVVDKVEIQPPRGISFHFHFIFFPLLYFGLEITFFFFEMMNRSGSGVAGSQSCLSTFNCTKGASWP